MWRVKYILFGVISLAVNLFVFFTAWFWAFWAALFKLEKLPWPFSLLHTHDDNIYGSITTGVHPDSFFSRWWAATWWMMRNPAYGFDAFVLGIDASLVLSVKSIGTITEGIHDTITTKNKVYYGYRRDFYYRKGGKRYCKMWFGYHYKAQGKADKRHMFKIDLNPFKSK